MGQCFADEVAREAANNNVFAQFRDFRAHQFPDCLVGILDESLLQQTNRAIKLLQFSVDNFIHHRFRFAFDLPLINFALGFNQRSGHVVPTDVEGMRRRNMQGDVLYESAEILVLGHEIGLAIYFHQHPHFPLQMNVGSDDSFFGRARGFFSRTGDAFRAEHRFRLFQITSRFCEGAFAIHHAGVGFFPELLNELGIDFHCS